MFLMVMDKAPIVLKKKKGRCIQGGNLKVGTVVSDLPVVVVT